MDEHAADERMSDVDKILWVIEANPQLRSIITLDITRVTDSCGYGVPFFTYQGERDQLLNWCQKKTPEELAAYHLKKNTTSIDGLPGLNPQSAH